MSMKAFLEDVGESNEADDEVETDESDAAGVSEETTEDEPESDAEGEEEPDEEPGESDPEDEADAATGEQEASGASPDAETSTEKTSKTVPLAVVREERKRRQDAERQLRELREQVTRAQQKAPEAEPDPDFWQDPEKAYRHALARAESAGKVGEVERRMMRAEVSEMLARQKHDDYDEVIEPFVETLQADPVLLAEYRRSKDPGEVLYKMARSHRRIKEVSDIDAYEEKLKASIRKEVEAELEKNGRLRKAAAVPTSLSKVGGASRGMRSAPAGSSDAFDGLFRTKRR